METHSRLGRVNNAAAGGHYNKAAGTCTSARRARPEPTMDLAAWRANVGAAAVHLGRVLAAERAAAVRALQPVTQTLFN